MGELVGEFPVADLFGIYKGSTVCYGLACEFIATLILRVSSVAPHPVPLNIMCLRQLVKALPQIFVEDIFFLRVLPVPFFP